MAEEFKIPNLNEIREARKLLGDKILLTPVWEWKGQEKDVLFGKNTQLFLKLETLQYGGCFKLRGALLNMMALKDSELKNGVTAISAGNHAIAVASAAKQLGIHAKVVIPKTANKFRVQRCQAYGAEIIYCDTINEGFNLVQEIAKQESRAFIHPFEGYHTALGTATLGLEFAEQTKGLDAVVIAIGGGGLCAGVSNAFSQAQPSCTIYGVEPEGADTMNRSFMANKPMAINKIQTIADSLGAPKAEPYSFHLCKLNVDKLVTVSDQELITAMKLIAEELKMMVEPACAAGIAACLGPLKNELHGKRIGIIFCGSNMDISTFCGHCNE
ncbi:threonine/serine dehydratase [Fluoribacter dumoffii]|uniref:Phenylserine dehydratase n=1 Tax=Fluoribacter dumoffii TaxID=463 RepID=A0A377G6G0_9GAMM|nr:threonine/serine dehydratase [Fluoribacter dumoffii]KTC92368.1 Phenylserine dehydratase [Fluoribacter dumoffii NY 23]MCW8386945.1 threonine/serine dehydratase [Fluoribacter dumoffii]MCW8417552.1 threonine/serine dehydratase [Fluoribacter dumoffii]MCW8454607.1 threonine/serine dehydratase [Fluoribacter dumoffii]MCW8461317.1 threonine/serine dehydratase [Fluoribacter dumoffii]